MYGKGTDRAASSAVMNTVPGPENFQKYRQEMIIIQINSHIKKWNNL